jgi:hypothetical protein
VAAQCSNIILGQCPLKLGSVYRESHQDEHHVYVFRPSLSFEIEKQRVQRKYETLNYGGGATYMHMSLLINLIFCEFWYEGVCIIDDILCCEFW